jgi:putative sigma-54 modulation protein
VRIVYDFEKHRHRYRVDMDVYLNTPGGGVIHAWEESNDLESSIERPLIVVEPLPSEKPMTVEDARLLEETGAFFLPFINSETGEVNVIYGKKQVIMA